MCLHHSRYLRQNLQSWERTHSVARSGAAGVTEPSSMCLLVQHGWRWDARNLLQRAQYGMWTCRHGGWDFPCIFLHFRFRCFLTNSAGKVKALCADHQWSCKSSSKNEYDRFYHQKCYFDPIHIQSYRTRQVYLATYQDGLRIPPGIRRIDASQFLAYDNFQQLLAKKVEIVHISVSWPEIWVEEANVFVKSCNGIFTENTYGANMI